MSSYYNGSTRVLGSILAGIGTFLTAIGLITAIVIAVCGADIISLITANAFLIGGFSIALMGFLIVREYSK
jgi:hypothetical protein